MRNSIAIFVLALAALQLVSANHKVQVLFSDNYKCNVTAHFNHEDDVIIRLTIKSNSSNSTNGTNHTVSNRTLPTLELVNLAGYYPLQNTTSLLTEFNLTKGRTYRFKYWNATGSRSPCVQNSNGTLTCRFKLYSPVTWETTDIYLTMGSPNGFNPDVTIFGTGYNNNTWNHSTIDLKEVKKTANLTKHIHVNLLSVNESAAVRYFMTNATDRNASAMLASLKPMFLAFQCHYSTHQQGYRNGTNTTSFNVLSAWNGTDGLYPSTSVNLADAGLPFSDDSNSTFTEYWCNMSVILTERNSEHSYITVGVENRVWVEIFSNNSNHSNSSNSSTWSPSWVSYSNHSNHSNDSNSSNSTWRSWSSVGKVLNYVFGSNSTSSNNQTQARNQTQYLNQTQARNQSYGYSNNTGRQQGWTQNQTNVTNSSSSSKFQRLENAVGSKLLRFASSLFE